MHLKIKTIELVPDAFGKHIKITRIGLYDDTDKWLRWVKLNEDLIKHLQNIKIPVSHE